MTLAIVVTVLVLMALFAIAIVAIDYATRWPEPVEMARPFPCDRCACSFRDARWLGMHMRAQHPEAYDMATRAPGKGPGLLVVSPVADTDDDHSGLAQLAEHATLDRVVEGSTPSPRTDGARS